MTIIEANIAEQAKEIQCLFLQYYDELLGIDVCFHDFDDELINLEQILLSAWRVAIGNE